jgi:hypothetical protein
VTSRSGNPVAVAAIVKANAAKKRKPTTKTTKVKVGSGSYSLATGQRATIKVTLNSTGQKLLDRFYRLPATVAITGTTSIVKKVTFSYSRIRSPIFFTWAFTSGYSIAQKLSITGLPSKSKVTVICHGGGCPFVKRVFTPHGRQLALTSSLNQSHLTPHTTLELEITAANDVGKIAIFRILSGQQPSLTELCLLPGASRPTACA